MRSVNLRYKEIKHDSGFSKYEQFVKKIENKLNRDENYKQNVVTILKFLALNGKTTAWKIALKGMSKKNIRNANFGRKKR